MAYNNTIRTLVDNIIEYRTPETIDTMLNYCMFNLPVPNKQDIEKLRPMCDDIRANGDEWSLKEWELCLHSVKEEVLPIAIIKFLISGMNVSMDSGDLPKETEDLFRERYSFLFIDTIQE